MELNDIIGMGTQLFQDKLGEGAEGLDSNVLTEALGGLLSNEEGGLDLGNIMSAMTDEEGGLGSIVSSWIGSGENEAIDGSQLTNLLGSDAISSFAEKLGIDPDTALSGLTDAFPNMVDQATPDGASMLESAGGLSGILGMVGKLFGKS